MAGIFDPTRCGSDPVSLIGAIDLVPDCTVPAGPDRLRECPEPTFSGFLERGAKGDKGDTGDTGDKGETGDPGPDGEDGADTAITTVSGYTVIPWPGPPSWTLGVVPQGGGLYRVDSAFFLPDPPNGCIDDCNLWMWCNGGWVAEAIYNTDDIIEPSIDGTEDGQTEIVCPCDSSSDSIIFNDCCGEDSPHVLKADLVNAAACGCPCGPVLDPHNLRLDYVGTRAMSLCSAAVGVHSLPAGTMKWKVDGVYGGSIVLEADCSGLLISLRLIVTCCCSSSSAWQLIYVGTASVGSCSFDTDLTSALPSGPSPPVGCPGSFTAHLTTP